MRYRRMMLAAAMVVCGGAQAASCGTFASPIPCSLTVGGQVTYTVDNFALLNSAGTKQFTGADVLIDLAALGGNIRLSFSKNASGPTPGLSFAVNPTQSAGLTLAYRVQVAAAQPGTASLVDIDPDVEFSAASVAGNGLATAQLIRSFGASSTSCLAIQNSGGKTPGICGLPALVSNSLDAGDIISLSGNNGNAAIGQVDNFYGAVFTPANAVPEPGTWGTLGIALAMTGWSMRRRVNARPPGHQPTHSARTH